MKMSQNILITKLYSKFKWLLRRKIPSIYWTIYYQNYKVYKKLENRKNKEGVIIVSLTSFSQRFEKLYITLNSIFNQTLKPDTIIVYIAEKDYTVLPNSVKSLIKYGLILKRVNGDMKSHKKYLYAMQDYPKSLIITVDDDIIYDKKMIERLYKVYLKYPNCIIANRVHQIIKNNTGDTLSYNNWIHECKNIRIPNKCLLATTGAGTLFPPHLMYEKDLFNEALIKELSYSSDDIWLKFMQVLSNTNVVWTGYTKKLIVTNGLQSESLAELNVNQKYNDICIQSLEEYYNMKIID